MKELYRLATAIHPSLDNSRIAVDTTDPGTELQHAGLSPIFPTRTVGQFPSLSGSIEAASTTFFRLATLALHLDGKINHTLDIFLPAPILEYLL
jgi:hypothetical protein